MKLGCRWIVRWETVMRIIVPEATPGILTGVILSSGRIFGEAAALIYTAGSECASVRLFKLEPAECFQPDQHFPTSGNIGCPYLENQYRRNDA